MINKLTRRGLLGGAGTLVATAAFAKPRFLRGGRDHPAAGPPPPPPPPPPVEGLIVTAAVVNPTAAPLVNPTVQFFQPFIEGDLQDGQTLVVTDATGGNVPYTAARRANWPESPTNRSGADLFCMPTLTLPAKRSLASITISGTTATATATAPHGLASGNEVLIQATTDVSIPNPNPYYYGLVPVTVLDATRFSYTVIGLTPAGPSTIPMEMCYATRLSMNAATGAWNDTLPAGKTVSNIIVDLQANHDNIAIELLNLQENTVAATPITGTLVGSGSWKADFFTTMAQAGTDKLRVVATGPTLCDFVGIMKFADTANGTRHSSLSGWFYVSCILDHVTGAIVDIHARCFIDQTLGTVANSLFVHNARLRLGNTIVRSSGLSSDPAIDGRKPTFLPAAVNPATNIINIPNHGFSGSERVVASTTGTLPSGLVANTNYYTVWVDKDNIKLSTALENANMFGSQVAQPLGTQGTGTHTLTCLLLSPPWVRQPLIGKEARPDRWVGKTGTLRGWPVHVVHDTTYMQLSRIIPGIDLTVKSPVPIAQTTPVAGNVAAALKARYVFGSLGPAIFHTDNGGGGGYHIYGMVWNHISCAHAHYPSEIGIQQMHRATAFGLTAFMSSTTDGEVNWRPYVFNNGPDRAGGTYPNMGVPHPTANWFPGNNVYTGITRPLCGYKGNPGLGQVSPSHRYTSLPQLYSFDGRQELHDLMVFDANYSMAEHFTGVYKLPGTGISTRTFDINGTKYYGVFPGPNLNERGDGANMNVHFQVLALASATAPEYPYLKMIADDTLEKINYLIFTQAAIYDPDWLDMGGWYGYNDTLGPGANISVDGKEGLLSTLLFQFLPHCYMLYPTALHKTIATQMGKLYHHIYDTTTFQNVAYSSTYSMRTMTGMPGHTPTPNKHMPFAVWKTAPIIEDDGVNGTIALPNGLLKANVPGLLRSYDPHHQAGDVHVITQNGQNGDAQKYKPIPAELVEYDVRYYVFPVDGTYASGYRYSTTSDDSGMINSYALIAPGTISTTMTTATTQIVTTADYATTGMVLSFGYAYFYITSGAGSEVVGVNLVVDPVTHLPIPKTYNLQRGLFGTVALAHGANAAVGGLPIFAWYADLQNRTVPYPPVGQGIGGSFGTSWDFGYRTMARFGLGLHYLAGLTPTRDAFDNCTRWWDDPAHAGGNDGLAGQINNNGRAWSVNINLPVLNK